MDNIINKVILSLSKKKDILLFNSHDIIAISMEIIESFNGLVGSLKSQIVKDILLEILNKNPLVLLVMLTFPILKYSSLSIS